MLIFKARVKSIEVEDNGYYVTFDYCDKIKNSEGEYGIAYEDGKDPNLKSLALKDKFKVVDEIIFSFISQHTREVLEVSYEPSSGDTSNPHNIKKVKLSYE